MRKVVLVLFIFLAIMASSCKARQSGSGTSGAAASNVNFTGYPMNKPNEKVTWADLDGENLATRIASVADSPFHVNFNKMLGTTVEWIFPTVGTPPAQMFAQIMAGNIRELPNIINGGGGVDAEQLIEEGVMWDLTPYMEQWAPNYVKFLQTRPERAKAMKTDSGKYWTFGFFREDGPFMDTWVGPFVRKDWLDAQGLPIPKTIADWDRTLDVLKSKYNAVLSFERTFGNNPFVGGAYGAYATYNFEIYFEGGRAKAANITPEYRNYLAKLNEWYTKGYLDPDHLTVDMPTYRSRAMEGQIGIGYGALSRVTALVNDAEGAKNGADWVGFEYPKGPNDLLVSSQGGWGANGNAWVTKSVTPDKLELVMRVLDYSFTEEGFYFTNFGIKGDTWDFDSSGKVAWLPKFLNDIDAPDYQQVVMKYGVQRGGQAGIQATRLVELINAPASFASALVWFYPNEAQAYTWRMPPAATLTVAESLRHAELRTPINTYVSEMAIGFVTGQVPLSQFDAFVARLNQMGLAEVLSIQQAVYDRWQKR
jgi:putative aldouronate transport system substrate-binding protein